MRLGFLPVAGTRKEFVETSSFKDESLIEPSHHIRGEVYSLSTHTHTFLTFVCTYSLRGIQILKSYSEEVCLILGPIMLKVASICSGLGSVKESKWKL